LVIPSSTSSTWVAAEFPPATPSLADALLYCDMTTGPDGDYVRPADRLAEICARYGQDHVVTRFEELATQEILTVAGRVQMMLATSAQIRDQDFRFCR
jgi:hypothetical protein